MDNGMELRVKDYCAFCPDFDADVDVDADDDEQDDEVSLCNTLDAVCFEVPYFSANEGHIILTAITTTPAINKPLTVFLVSFFIIRSTFFSLKHASF